MRNTFAIVIAAALVVLAMPTKVDAYGAAHYGYTHVGPSGVYHTGGSVAYGPRGVAETGHTSAYGYGGASYHAGYGAAAGYRYAPSYGYRPPVAFATGLQRSLAWLDFAEGRA